VPAQKRARPDSSGAKAAPGDGQTSGEEAGGGGAAKRARTESQAPGKAGQEWQQRKGFPPRAHGTAQGSGGAGGAAGGPSGHAQGPFPALHYVASLKQLKVGPLHGICLRISYLVQHLRYPRLPQDNNFPFPSPLAEGAQGTEAQCMPGEGPGESSVRDRLAEELWWQRAVLACPPGWVATQPRTHRRGAKGEAAGAAAAQPLEELHRHVNGVEVAGEAEEGRAGDRHAAEGEVAGRPLQEEDCTMVALDCEMCITAQVGGLLPAVSRCTWPADAYGVPPAGL
jgi:hypothetical protein